MLCPECGAENRENARFCDQCGSALRGTESAADKMRSDAGVAEQDGAPIECDVPDEPASVVEEPDDESIETDYELYQPIESESTDSIDPGAAVDKLVFAGEEELLEPVSKNELDLTGFDRHSEEYTERLATGDMLAQAAFRDGNTMQMPHVEGEEPAKSKDYLASSTTKQKGRGKIVAAVLIAIAAALAIAAFATYQMGIWGGKIVPDVVGLTETDAKTILVDAGFTTRSQQVKSDDTEGLVLIMDPAANSRADEGSEVVIHIATARTIPDVVGMSKDEAEKALSQEGYESVKTKKKNSEKKAGTVIEVSPKVGEHALSSAEVTLTLAQPYSVPDISGMSFDDAVSALKKAGYGYDVLYISTESYPEGTIIGTDPAAGTNAEKGTYVMIQIAQSRGSELEDLALSALAEGTVVDSGGTSYIIESVDSVAFIGNNTVSYTATGRPFTSFFGETFTSSMTQSISGTVVFDDDNDVVAIS